MKLYSTVVSEAEASRQLYVLHGIFGSGRNWSSVIRRFVRSRPEWGARLIDLRQHGGSQGFDPPHTLTAAARDIAELARASDELPVAVLGHSFGGKVALTYARDHGDHQPLERVWIIDSTPEARTPDGSAWQMLELLRRMPQSFASCAELIELLVRSGITTPTAQWMATNLEQGAGGRYSWRFDLAAIEALLRDFYDQDLWGVLEQPPGRAQIHVVKAKESSILSPAAVQRIHELSAGGRVFYHEVDGGHWVNAENPEALLALMTRHL
ncbi:MAG: alpha/beta fold hydrolase [Gemmatimonadota bacterium]